MIEMSNTNFLGSEKTDRWAVLRAFFRRAWWLIVMSGLLCASVALIVSLFQTPIYESSATLYVTSASDGDATSAYQGSLASQQRVASYAELVDSDAIVTGALRESGVDMSVDEARAALSATSAPGTVLLTIRAQDPSSDVASRLVNGAATAMTNYIRELEQSADGGQRLAKLTVVSPGVAPSDPVSPDVKRNTVLGFLIGGLAGMLAAFTRERFDTKLRSSADLHAVSGKPALGEIPREEGLAADGVLDFSFGSSAASEAYRRLRTNLEFVNVDEPARIIVVSSANENEGKTTTSLNLAASLAEAGGRVVIVDADLRRPSVAKRLSLNPDIGVTDSLRAGVPIADLIQQTSVAGLSALASGALPPNPAELLGSQRAKTVFDELASAYDFVIVDSPPILPVADTSIMARWVDGVLLVARAGRTRSGDITSAINAVSAAGGSIIGALVNLVDRESSRYQYTYYASEETVAIKK
ncbi:polysaccharide biosynthesis tyrosine autokinase [Gordonia alkanivorans]|uniref:polysaccharide biosynthesis tyrosine autokinase n=1 Tax=Gordonia alkanivorans TaxID=84096 RepID=UPI00244787AB|nr:polysaccharide biosynthesis tyrosine autokinase [Gordonia alkanivorans]MDH3012552.1 polysaccharide biosynthesis tyrosine autokinase [Gordonia alkanivorans]